MKQSSSRFFSTISQCENHFLSSRAGGERGGQTPALTDVRAGIRAGPAGGGARSFLGEGTYLDMSCWVWDSLNHVLQEASSLTVHGEAETAGRQKGTVRTGMTTVLLCFLFPKE